MEWFYDTENRLISSQHIQQIQRRRGLFTSHHSSFLGSRTPARHGPGPIVNQGWRRSASVLSIDTTQAAATNRGHCPSEKSTLTSGWEAIVSGKRDINDARMVLHLLTVVTFGPKSFCHRGDFHSNWQKHNFVTYGSSYRQVEVEGVIFKIKAC